MSPHSDQNNRAARSRLESTRDVAVAPVDFVVCWRLEV